MGDGKGNTIETTINIDGLGLTQQHNGKETASNCHAQPNNGEKISRIIVSQDDSYVVTHSKDNNSIRGWLVNVKENEKQQTDDLYFVLETSYKEFKLYKKFLLSYNYVSDSDSDRDHIVNLDLIDLSGNKVRIFQLKLAENISTKQRWIEFLPNGDLILLSLDKKLKVYKIYLYPFTNLQTDTTLWKYSRIFDIKFHESLNEHTYIDCIIIHQKLFLFNEGYLAQWDLSTMTFERHYNLASESVENIVINKNQTLLASYDEINEINIIDIYSMETGMRISRHDSENYFPMKFVTSKNGSEGLIIRSYDKKRSYKIFNPIHSSKAIDAIDITDNIGEYITFITESNKQFYVKENLVYVKDGVNEDRFQQMLNKTTCRSNIYTLPIFNTIQNMLKDINNRDFTESNPIEVTDGEPFHFNLEEFERGYGNEVKVKGFTQNNNERKETRNSCVSSGMLVSYKQLLSNQALALITTGGIYIYTIVEDFLRLRYFWNNEELDKYYDDNSDDNNNELVNYKRIIQNILNNEFKDKVDNESKDPLPSPNFKICSLYAEYYDLVFGIINDREDFSKFGSEILDIAIKAINDKSEIRKVGDTIIKLIFDKIIDLINEEDYSLLPIIGLKIPKLCDHRYSSLVIKYILHMSMLLDSTCLSVKNLANTSLYAYSKDIDIKESILPSNNYFRLLSFSHYLRTRILSFYYYHLRTPILLIPTISFIVPFPKICNYQTDYSAWNEFLYQPKSIVFCNIDSNNFYKWWNFAAIIDFKWKTFGRFYYFTIWFFYNIFYLCFALATTLDLNDFHRRILFILTILLGLIHLSFEFRQLLWKRKFYINDLWNFFDVGAYSLPVIASIYWLINENSSLQNTVQITAISILFLHIKFLLFLRVFEEYGGKIFILMINIGRKVFPFLAFLFLIITGFAYAFFILLRSIEDNDGNDPWNLVTKYSSVNSDGTINSTPTLIQIPDSNTNLFNWFPTSLLAMYLILAGNSESLSLWTYRENPTITLLLVIFSFYIVIYLMNLFIGVLNLALQDYNTYEEYLLIKAQIIIEIELFYLLPYQRQKKEWFSDWIYYYMPVDEVYKLINAIDSNKTEFNAPPFISKQLRKLIELPEPIDEIKDELKQTKDELKDVKILLNNLIKNLNTNNDNI